MLDCNTLEFVLTLIPLCQKYGNCKYNLEKEQFFIASPGPAFLQNINKNPLEIAPAQY